MKSLWWVFIVIIVTNGCGKSRVSPSIEYRNNVQVESRMYTADSLIFINYVLDGIQNKNVSFYRDYYTYTHKVFIDTIIYNPELNRVAFLVIFELPNHTLITPYNISQPYPDGYHFNAKCFLAQRDTLSTEWDMKWFRIMNLNRYSTYDRISSRMRQFYFEQLNDIKTHGGKSRYLYNMNDSRFWESPAWTERAQMLEKNVSGD